MPLISSNRLLFLAPRRRRYEDVETAALDLALDVAAAPARMLTAEAGALVDDIDQVIALEDRPTPLGSDLAFEAEVAELSDYPCLVKLSSVSLVIPTLNEEANIGWVLQRVPAWVEEVIVVDGGSKDRTVEVAKTIRPDVVVVTELRKGKGVALRTGFATATREVIVMIDADGSMDPAEIES
ncbi:MAG: glycosyltransferase family 2 protein, partial [Actinobacteria bacterium]|nr:glycosyltransferase family 2 protein [Actinomycetota bacterium]